MARLARSSVFGLLWLALGATGFATSLTIQDQNFPVENGGGGSQAFTVNPNNLFEIFCADYLNFVGPVPDSYDANISTLPNIANTRYGTTLQASFLFQAVPNGQPQAGQSLGDAVNRYLLAGWLTTQYDFTLNANTGNKDIGIQNAIWDLLNVKGGSPQTGDVNIWLNNAVAWEMGQTMPQLNAFAANVRVYTSIDVAGISGDARYTTGKQEFVSVVPEPAAFLLMGGGLLGIGIIARRRRH